VEIILYFVAASRNANLHFYLQAGEALSKLFFAMDRLKYKRIWPRYISDMHALKTDHPDTWKELEEGNITVTKGTIPFVSVGADHACEQLNRLMKANGGLTGISNNPNARQRSILLGYSRTILPIIIKDCDATTRERGWRVVVSAVLVLSYVYRQTDGQTDRITHSHYRQTPLDALLRRRLMLKFCLHA